MFFFFQNNKIADTSAEQARKGKDIQGIPWDRLSISREKYRQTRLEQYKNYENVPNSGEASEKVRIFNSLILHFLLLARLLNASLFFLHGFRFARSHRKGDSSMTFGGIQDLLNPPYFISRFSF